MRVQCEPTLAAIGQAFLDGAYRCAMQNQPVTVNGTKLNWRGFDWNPDSPEWKAVSSSCEVDYRENWVSVERGSVIYQDLERTSYVTIKTNADPGEFYRKVLEIAGVTQENPRRQFSPVPQTEEEKV